MPEGGSGPSGQQKCWKTAPWLLKKSHSVHHLAISVLRKIKGKAYEHEVVLFVLAVKVAVTLLTVYSFRLLV
jgi:hypothetical protein